MSIAWKCVSSVLAVALLSSGCRSDPKRVERLTIDAHDAYRLTDGKVEAIVEPAKRRIMRFGKVGGRNLFWVNPSAKPGKPGEHVAWGGEKAWLWPQERWPKSWPPGMDVEGRTEVAANPVGRHGFPVSLLGYGMTRDQPPGVCLFRQPTLRSTGELVVQTMQHSDALYKLYSFEKGWAAWSIAQVDRPAKVYARLIEDAFPVPKALPPFRSDQTLQIRMMDHAKMIEIDLGPGDQGRKVGLDADRLLAVYPDGTALLVEGRIDENAPPYRPGERAQVYVDPPKGSDARFVELEFTAPLTPKDGTPTPLTTVYSIHDNVRTADDAIRVLMSP